MITQELIEAEERPIITEHFSSDYKVKSLAPIEIFGSKINALLSRAAARDLNSINKTFDTKAIDLITNQKIKRELLPVIKKKDDFKFEEAKKLVKEYISDLMVLTREEKKFLDEFESGKYIPELLFEDKEILDRIKNHPMAFWKTRVKNH